MREAQLHLILVQEVLGHRALHRLPVLQLEGEALHLRRAPRNIAHPILALHRAAVGDLNLEALDLLGELDALGVGERSALIIDVPYVQHLAHEIDHRLRLEEGRRRHVDVEHHLPLAGPHRLVKAKPHLAAPAERVVIPLGAERDTWGIRLQNIILILTIEK